MSSRTFTALVRHSGPWLPLLGASALAGTLGMLALPVVLGRAVDAIATGGEAGVWLMAAGGLIALGVVCELVDAFAGTACVAGTTAWLRDRLVGHVLAAGSREPWETGDLVTRVSANAAEAARAGPVAVTAWTAVLPPVGCLAMLTYLDPWLALAFLAGLTLVALVLRAFTRRTAEIVGAYQRVQGAIAARFTEALSGVRTIAAAGTVDKERERVLTGLPELSATGTATWRILSRSSAQAAVVGPLVLLCVLATGGLLLVAGRITPGDLLAAAQYATIGAGLGGLTGVFGQLARTRAGARRAGEVLGAAPIAYGDAAAPDGPGTLVFQGVSAEAGDAVLLSDVDLELPGGAVVAVVGRSGSGKSVLAELAARLRDPSAGRVLLDGVPLDRWRHADLREAVSCASERPVLVGATVGEAIGPGRDEESLRAAARAADADDFIRRLPHGYGTPLEDAPMSGGERQRLGLARAWHASRLLVLDDATSSVDTVTELRIARALTGDGRRRTRLVTTHRANTAARADLVVWLESGRVRAVGTHAELWGDAAYREVFG